MTRHTIMRDRRGEPVRLGGARHGAVRTACGRWVELAEADVRRGVDCADCARALADARDDIWWEMSEASYARRARRMGA